MKYTPKLVKNTFDELDYERLYNAGYHVILTDLDNTLASYKENKPSKELIGKIKRIKSLGFKIYLVSNNKNERINTFVNKLGLDGALSKAGKPKCKKLLAFINKENIQKDEVIAIGDQLVTDIQAYNAAGFYSVLVNTIDKKTQKWYTKINRLREKKIIKEIKKENPDIGRKIEEL